MARHRIMISLCLPVPPSLCPSSSPCLRWLTLSNFSQGLIEIAKHIDLVFQADRNSHQTFIDSGGLSQLARKLKAPHRRGMYDQSLESAQAGGTCGEAESGYKFIGGRVASAQFD